MSSTDKEKLQEGSLISHLVELRTRLLRSILSILIIFICLVPFAENIFTSVATPLMNQLPSNATMIATQVASPFLTPFKMTLFVALFLAMPVILYQLWQFVVPGLYRKEKRFAFPLLISSILLFYLGVAFSYFVVFPIMFAFFAAVAPEGVTMMTDISAYLDFIITLFFAFGLAFEVPIATVILVWSGLASREKLASWRPYVFLGAFIMGMLLTPPDAISQTLLAVPVYLLYESGLFLLRFLKIDKQDKEK
ncbi:MAG: twin-arginine translocase subunit TatC [Gammaproteobacteria bacterium TMED78]|nr:MAG: twin-arginine translocase subunit TatC [Gammaproteobacteria bacterium TMED78]|tara:strand:+ start:171481 stop:172233 length:753 start_codon:yes stop_codon:yes gene_type:complete